MNSFVSQNDPGERLSRINDNITIVLSLYKKLLVIYNEQQFALNDVFGRNNSTRANTDKIIGNFKGPIDKQLTSLKREIQTLSKDFTNSKAIETNLTNYLIEQVKKYMPVTKEDIEKVIRETHRLGRSNGSRNLKLPELVLGGKRHTKKRRRVLSRRKRSSRARR
jgi:hypothetical protein